MAVNWTSEERSEVEAAIIRFPVESGYCAALARVVHRVGVRRDAGSRGLQIRPRYPARFVEPQHGLERPWYSHTFVATHEHAVDALTGADGCEESSYLVEFWRHAEELEILEVNVELVDVGSQDEP